MKPEDQVFEDFRTRAKPCRLCGEPPSFSLGQEDWRSVLVVTCKCNHFYRVQRLNEAIDGNLASYHGRRNAALNDLLSWWNKRA